MSLEKLALGDRVKLRENWSTRGVLVLIMLDEHNDGTTSELGVVRWDGMRNDETEIVPLTQLVHLSYTWGEDWVPL